MKKRLSNLLVEERVVDVGTMERAFGRIDKKGGRLGTNLLELDAIDPDTFQLYLSEALDMPAPTASLLAGISDEMLLEIEVKDVIEYEVIPACREGDSLLVLVRDPIEEDVREELEEKTGKTLRPFVLPDFRFEHALSALYAIEPSPRATALIEKYPARIGLSGMTGQFVAIRDIGEESTAEYTSAKVQKYGKGWSTDQISRFLAHAEDRDQIIDALMGFVVGQVSRCFILAIQRNTLRGFSCSEMNVDSDRLRRIEFSGKRLLKRCVISGSGPSTGFHKTLD